MNAASAPTPPQSPTPGRPVTPAPAAAASTGARLFIATASVAAIGIAIVASYGLWASLTPFETTDNAYVRGDLTFVAAKVPGYVVEVATENNRRVAPGQILARIDPRDYQAAVADAEASLAQQKAAALQIDAQFQLQQAQIEVAQAAVATAQAQALKARSDFARAKDLVSDGAVSRSAYEQATAEDVHARSSVTQSMAQAIFARRQLAVLEAQRQANLAAQLGASAKLFKARNDLSSTAITAPREGLVAARNVRLGEFVGVGTRLMAVAPTRALWIEANLRETQLSRIRAGDRVQIRVDAANDQVFCGTVESLSAASGSEFSVIPPDNATGNFTKIVRRFPVRILFDARQPGLGRLGSGMSVEPKIAIGSHSSGKPGAMSALFGGFDCATGNHRA
jgi:membrane fusion protein (multidrug efflux system)